MKTPGALSTGLAMVFCAVGLFGLNFAAPERDPAAAAVPHAPIKKRLAVMDMEIKVATTMTANPTPEGGQSSAQSISVTPPSDFGSGLTEMLTTALMKTDRFVLLERKALGDIQAEQNLLNGSASDPTAAPTANGLLGAQVLLRGAVTEYSYNRSSIGGKASFLKGLGLGKARSDASVVLDIRLYDVATGQIISAQQAEGRARSSAWTSEVNREDIQMGSSGSSNSPLGQATRQAINRAVVLVVEQLDQLPWEARVVELDADEAGAAKAVYVNAGSRSGLKEGDLLEVSRPGRTIVDPATRQVLGRTRDTRSGLCRIESLTMDLAVAVPVEGNTFQREDVVRWPSPSGSSPADPPTSPPVADGTEGVTRGAESKK